MHKPAVSLTELFAGGGTLGFSLVRGMSQSCDIANISGNEIDARYINRWSELHPLVSLTTHGRGGITHLLTDRQNVTISILRSMHNQPQSYEKRLSV